MEFVQVGLTVGWKLVRRLPWVLAAVSVLAPLGIPQEPLVSTSRAPSITISMSILFEIHSVDFFLLFGWWSYFLTVQID